MNNINTSRRTISYIGLWALIMPWLGFSWETKTVLFSLTGIVLLIVGNRQYHNEKKRQKINIVPNINPVNDINPVNPEITPIDDMVFIQKVEIPRVEIPRRVRKISIKTENYEQQ